MVRGWGNSLQIFLPFRKRTTCESFCVIGFQCFWERGFLTPGNNGGPYYFLFCCFLRRDIDLYAQRELFSHVTARLNDSEQALCEGPLTLAEASEALCKSNRNKSPGVDGLTVEFYPHFWDKLGELLVNVFNQSLEWGDLPESMKASVTRLVHKRNDKRVLKNWRPISLLNVDYKICSKAISLQLAKVLSS